MNQNGKYLLDTNILIAMLADDMIIHTQDERQNVPKVSCLRRQLVSSTTVCENQIDL